MDQWTDLKEKTYKRNLQIGNTVNTINDTNKAHHTCKVYRGL